MSKKSCSLATRPSRMVTRVVPDKSSLLPVAGTTNLDLNYAFEIPVLDNFVALSKGIHNGELNV